MGIKNRRKAAIATVGIAIALCVLMSCVLINCGYSGDNVAQAIKAGTSTEAVGELLLSDYTKPRPDNNVFDGEKMEKLYALLTGNPNAKYSDVASAASNKRTSKNLRDQNGGKLITVTIDGIEWNAVYLSTNNSGDPIVTLWQANSTTTAKWNYHAVNANANIPSNMYSTSMIRNITLNAGGTYYTSNAGSGATTVPQDSGNTYAKYTMDSVTGSLTDFIDKPANVSWQANEISHKVNGYAYDFNNDAYGNVGSGGGNNANWYSGMVNYYGKTDYSAWANDYIWLPSMTEAGWYEGTYTAKGIWDTSAAERGNSGGDSWLRSADASNYSYAYTLLSDGSVADSGAA
ncbi:MAG: hypothetical protein K2N32_02115, partial [Clostridia bacterium]|nr:hypothetical protein [Clostridia bacterium]